MRRLEPKKTALIVVDIQERLTRAIPESQLLDLMRAAKILINAARVLNAPVLATEQYPKGLGPTVPEVRGLLDAAHVKPFEKTAFSACGAESFADTLSSLDISAAVVIGMETHVCVFQTVRDLVGGDIEVHVPIDGVASRRDDHRRTGLALCERAGAVRTTSETIVFDWLGRAGTPEFRELSPLLR
jgi:nicotinamidase-related amidase